MSKKKKEPEVFDVENSKGELEELFFGEEVAEVSVLINDKLVAQDLQNLKEKEIEPFDIYKTIIDTRKFEIDNFWKRTLFFWGTIAIMLYGYFAADNAEKYLIFVSYLGVFYNVIFSFSLRGSKYWQEHWEKIAISYEKNIGFNLFKWNLKSSIDESNQNVFFALKPYRFSVSKLTMILSDITVFFWIGLVIKDINYLLNQFYLKMDLCWFYKQNCISV